MKNAEIISLYVVQGSAWVSKKQRYENAENRRKAFIKISLANKPLREIAFSSLPPHRRGFYMSALYQLKPGLIANRIILRTYPNNPLYCVRLQSPMPVLSVKKRSQRGANHSSETFWPAALASDFSIGLIMTRLSG